MVEYERNIRGTDRPRRVTREELTCDECGAKCLPSGQGARHELLYEYDGAQLCYNCLIELLFDTADYAVVAE